MYLLYIYLNTKKWEILKFREKMSFLLIKHK